MIKLRKLNGEGLLLDEDEITTVEQIGGYSVVKTRRGGQYVVLETPEEIGLLLEAAERGTEVEVPSPPPPRGPTEGSPGGME